jgi:hypothetical protein
MTALSPPGHRPCLHEAGARWSSAFDSADGALRAARGSLPPPELRERGGRLTAERAETAALLDAAARAAGIHERFAYLRGGVVRR